MVMQNRISWAARRRAIAIVIFAIVIFIGIVFFKHTFFYNAPSCVDGIQNQNETGIDCGGTCPYLCVAQVKQPIVQFVHAFSNGTGRIDVIAYIENPNIDAAIVNTPYTIDLYEKGNKSISKTGLVTLRPHTITPIFIPNFSYTNQKIINVFLTFTAKKPHWFTVQKKIPILPFSNIQVTQGEIPHINATITNTTTTIFNNLKVIIVVFGSNNNVITASQTVVPTLDALGKAPLVFTWNKQFSNTPIREDLFPILPISRT